MVSDAKMPFHAAFDVVIKSISTEDKLIDLGDFNDKTEKQRNTWETSGFCCIGMMNCKGLYRLDSCSQFDVAISITIYKKTKNKKKKQKREVTSFDLWSKHVYQIYFIINLGWRCPWCNGYRRRNWTRRHEFKSWTRLIAFHIALIPLGKVLIQLFSLPTAMGK